MRGPCMVVLFSTDLHVLYVGFYYDLTRFELLDEDEAPGHVRMGTEKQGWLYA